VDAVTPVLWMTMLLYLDLAYEEAKREKRLQEPRTASRCHCARRRQACAPQVHDLHYHLSWVLNAAKWASVLLGEKWARGLSGDIGFVLNLVKLH
jgi:hypothetical protein